MKVLFCNPPWWIEPIRLDDQANGKIHDGYLAGVRAGSRWPHTFGTLSSPDNFVFGSYLPYPFFLGYAATYAARETDADITFRDSIALRESYENFLRHLVAGKYDMVVIESATPSWDHDVSVIQSIHKLLPSAKIVVTGPIATKADEILSNLPVYACIQGEYEKGIVRVIQGASGSVGHDLLTLDEMNTSPYPYFDETIAHRYWDGAPIGQKPPQLQIWTSRGCPYKCIFCVWPAVMTGNDPDGKGDRSVRQYSAEYIEGFIREMVDRYDYETIYFDDDTFNIGNRHVERICEVMTRIGKPWSAMCRADTIRKDVWRTMRDAGCFGVKLGFESGNQWVVDNIVNKRLDLEYGREVVHEVKSLGMSVHGTFTFGLPGETAEQMQDTRNFIASLPFDTVQESGTAEIEGTPLASLRDAEQLDAFPGARMDEEYARQSDGAAKWRDMSDGLTSG